MLFMSNKFTTFPTEPNPATVVSPPEVMSLRVFNLFRIMAIIEDKPTIIPESIGARKVILERMSETTSANKSFKRSCFLHNLKLTSSSGRLSAVLF